MIISDSCSNEFLQSFAADCLVPYAIYIAAYFIIATPFTIVDLLGCPERFRKYKVDRNDNHSITVDQVKKCIYVVLFNFIVVGLPFDCLLYLVRILTGFREFSKFDAESKYPWFLTMIIQMLLMAPMFSIIFFYCHCLLHWPRFYKRFHKQHHEWKAPISIATYYAHPVDHIVGNWFNVALPPFFVGADSTTVALWYAGVVFTQLCLHSGYKHPLLPNPEFHDYHHANFTKNFGASGLPKIFHLYLDRLHGTEAPQQKKKEK